MAAATGPGGDSIVLEEEVDPNYEPSQDEILEYARWLGMDPVEDADLLWVAREGLKVRVRPLRPLRPTSVCAPRAAFPPRVGARPARSAPQTTIP